MVSQKLIVKMPSYDNKAVVDMHLHEMQGKFFVWTRNGRIIYSIFYFSSKLVA